MSLSDIREQLRLALQRAEQAEQREEHAQQRAEQAEKQLRKTTLQEYLGLCHTHLFQSISVETIKEFTTKGETTKQTNKTRPDWLRPWTDFLAIQQDTQEQLLSVYADYDKQRAFESSSVMEGIGERTAMHKLGSEVTLAVIQRYTIEDPVERIVTHFQSIDAVREELIIEDGIYFDNHPNSLSDSAEEVSQRLENLEPFTPTRSTPSFNGLQADQICVYRISGDRKLAFVVEYKPPHKLSRESLRHGLREMEVKSVINRVSVPQDDGIEHFKYHADKLVASVVTQTFSYMIQSGTQYGYITTGEAFVFLHVRIDDPRTVYYHLIDPDVDVKAQKEAGLDFVHRSAVSQVLAFCLLALKSKPGSQRWRQDAIESLGTWNVDYEAILHEIPISMRKSPPDSEYIPKTYTPVGRLAMNLRTRKSCRPPPAPANDEYSSDASDSEFPPSTPTRPSGRVRGSQNPRTYPTRASKSPQRGGQSGKKRSFCTQHCLRGLAEGGPLDYSCPNVADHHGEGHESDRHLLDRQTFLTLLHQQLQENLDDDCYPLWKQGARGALFKVSLTSHGYTVVAKGTVRAFVEDLQHEYQVYRRLAAIQGTHIPVCLGNLDLVHPYYYDIGVLIVHMMIMSWGGESLANSSVLKHVDQKMLNITVTQSMDNIYGAGVLHTDLRAANVLWNQETGQVMLIDFERSEMIEGFQQALAEGSLNQKRKPDQPEKGVSGKRDYAGLKSEVESQFMNEIGWALLGH